MNIKNYNHKDALKIILDAATDYRDYLEDKNFMIIYYMNRELNYKLLNFNGANFRHLTGAQTKLSSVNFYNLCKDRKLSINDFEPPKGTMNLKLTALPFLPKLFFHGCSVGDFSRSGILLESDYFVGNIQKVSIGFKSGKNFDIPRSLLCEDIRKITNPTIKVEAIFRKDKKDLYFSDCTYHHKNFDMSLLDSCDFSKMIKNPRDYRVKKTNVTFSQVVALKNAKIPLSVQKISEDNFTIVYDRIIIPKVQKLL